uniref:RNA helicase n=1 Tax=Ditylenchus dipsaci TaxID=166011 RepID=A0A915DCJ7_9BILA
MKVAVEFGDKFGDLKPKVFGDKGNFFEGKSRENRQKFMPHQRDDSDLFDEKFLISEGPEFNEQFGDKNLCDIKITGGNGKYRHAEYDFDQCGLSGEIMNNLQKLKYHQLLTIQKVVVPMIQHEKYDLLKRQANISRNHAKPFALFIVPSKELVQQHYDFARTVAQGTDINEVRL